MEKRWALNTYKKWITLRKHLLKFNPYIAFDKCLKDSELFVTRAMRPQGILKSGNVAMFLEKRQSSNWKYCIFEHFLKKTLASLKNSRYICNCYVYPIKVILRKKM